MRLTHKDYKAPVKEGRVVPDVKEAIRSFVGKGSESYEEIVKHVQASYSLTNDEVIAQIREVSKEEAYTPKVVEVAEL